jgi:hypothetical protein
LPRARVVREQLKQSSRPPTRWRSELQPYVNALRHTTFRSSSSEPSPIPSSWPPPPVSKTNARPASYQRKPSTMVARKRK